MIVTMIESNSLGRVWSEQIFKTFKRSIQLPFWGFFLTCNSHVLESLALAQLVAGKLHNATHKIASNIIAAAEKNKEEEVRRRKDLDKADEVALRSPPARTAEEVACVQMDAEGTALSVTMAESNFGRVWSMAEFNSEI